MAKKKLKEASFLRLKDGTIVGPYQDLGHEFNEGLLEVKIDDKWGFIDERGEIIITPEYEKVDSFNGGLAKIKKDGKFGIINASGKIIVSPIYDNISKFKRGLASVVKDAKTGFINTNGELVIPLEFDSASDFQENVNLAIISKNGKEGVIDDLGNIIVPLDYSYLSLKVNAIIFEQDDFYGLMNLSGEKILKNIYHNIESIDFIDCPNSHYFCITVKDTDGIQKRGIVDHSGKIIVEPQYKEIKDFSENISAVKNFDDKIGFINLAGEEIVKPQYDGFVRFINGFSEVEIGNKTGIVNKEGKLVIDPIIENFGIIEREGLKSVKINGKWGFVNSNYEIVVRPSFEAVDYFSEGLVSFKQDNKWGFLDTEGNIIIEPSFKSVNNFHNGIALVTTIENNQEIIDIKGTPLISNIDFFSDAPSFRCGLQPIKIDGKYGYINPQGQMIISPQFEEANDFDESYGLASICLDGKWGLIDIKGNIVIEPQFSATYGIHDDMLAVKMNGSKRYFNVIEKTLLEPELEFDSNHETTNFENGLAIQKVKKKYGLIDKSGKWIVEPSFKSANLRHSNNIGIYRFSNL